MRTLPRQCIRMNEPSSRTRRDAWLRSSVNTDENQETLRTSIANGEINWRCWWESGTDGPICTKWMIESFPEVFLLDHKGVIRHHGANDKQTLDRAIDALLRECEGETLP